MTPNEDRNLEMRGIEMPRCYGETRSNGFGWPV
jgi:hypothetical protein